MTARALKTLEAVLDVIEEENLQLKAGDIPAAVLLLGRKEAALADLDKLDIVGERKSETDEDANCRSSELPEAARRLDHALQENRVLLRQAMTAQRLIVKLLTNALPSPDARTNYSNSGSYVAARRQPGRALRNNA
ncbi:flagellar protein FlgN [Acetobacter oeni]|uniref:Flagellar protein FlgN n=1 Tax=Acetobacter oeni TaxID=304077 RepID=A0A511XKJ1_9PROT|nr:flagellar protein FlgN [Acetobacter oeni]MBB3881341.1 flagellar biosynthesis/type III secretory pathway chaperone [Acetobacter oeni]NHO18213.1 flagellar protein FlgN [Acetobacter oeni]GBR11292.1 hypothetical protein AA21952_3322 [Acetobacter oeni LMG 21952]GEN63465.1 hypothetical protein AOE01nite_16890 [Acetobacter oeni]